MKIKKLLCLILSGLALCAGTITLASNYPESAKDIPDWRKTGTAKEQLQSLVNITPGTHHWMPEIAYRYQSLYWAAQQGRWEFAEYQVNSMEKMIKRVAQARPKRAASVQIFNGIVFPALYSTVKTRNWGKFSQAVANTGAQCMACHAREGFSFITVPSIPPKPSSIVLGFPEGS